MSEHLWFVPVTGGCARGPAPTPGLTNVQWNFDAYPGSSKAGVPELRHRSITKFEMGVAAPSLLQGCHGRWIWESTTSAADIGDENIITGGQLAVGTVFARVLPESNDPKPILIRWEQVDVWAKYRVVNKDALSNIFLTINDSAGHSAPDGSIDLLGNTPENEWKVMTVGYAGPWEEEEWDSDNLRVTLTFQGTTNPANVGRVQVDVEWFAIMLKPQPE